MKFKALFVTAAIIAIAFIKPAHGFAQVSLRDIGDDLKEFSDDISGVLPFMATIGLDWADTYIGQLIDITPHWGIGATIGAATLKLDKLNVLLEHFGYEADDGFIDKQLLPAYTLNARIGGFRTAPFDIGIKWGWLPYAPIFKNDISYESLVYGLDFRWQIMRDWGLMPSVAIGFEVSRTSGGLRSKSALTLATGNYEIRTSGDATIGPVWEAWVFDAKLQIAKNFWEPRFTAFGGLRLGAALSRAGYQIAGSGSDVVMVGAGTDSSGNIYDVALEDWSESALKGFAVEYGSASGNDINFELTSKSITGWIDSVTIDFNLHGGIAFKIDDNLRIDMALMVDVIHVELGANIGFRYQQ
jgi:hypothetical protein